MYNLHVTGNRNQEPSHCPKKLISSSSIYENTQVHGPIRGWSTVFSLQPSILNTIVKVETWESHVSHPTSNNQKHTHTVLSQKKKTEGEGKSLKLSLHVVLRYMGMYMYVCAPYTLKAWSQSQVYVYHIPYYHVTMATTFIELLPIERRAFPGAQLKTFSLNKKKCLYMHIVYLQVSPVNLSCLTHTLHTRLSPNISIHRYVQSKLFKSN